MLVLVLVLVEGAGSGVGAVRARVGCCVGAALGGGWEGKVAVRIRPLWSKVGVGIVAWHTPALDENTG